MPDPASSDDYSLVDHDVHVDPHGIAFSPDFTPWGPDYAPPTFGRALLVNDGGVEVSTDGLQTWRPGRGLAVRRNIPFHGLDNVHAGQRRRQGQVKGSAP